VLRENQEPWPEKNGGVPDEEKGECIPRIVSSYWTTMAGNVLLLGWMGGGLLVSVELSLKGTTGLSGLGSLEYGGTGDEKMMVDWDGRVGMGLL
jgi:hypothetical protein